MTKKMWPTLFLSVVLLGSNVKSASAGILARLFGGSRCQCTCRGQAAVQQQQRPRATKPEWFWGGRFGQTWGPYRKAEFDQYLKEGRFTYIWDEATRAWYGVMPNPPQSQAVQPDTVSKPQPVVLPPKPAPLPPVPPEAVIHGSTAEKPIVDTKPQETHVKQQRVTEIEIIDATGNKQVAKWDKVAEAYRVVQPVPRSVLKEQPTPAKHEVIPPTPPESKQKGAIPDTAPKPKLDLRPAIRKTITVKPAIEDFTIRHSTGRVLTPARLVSETRRDDRLQQTAVHVDGCELDLFPVEKQLFEAVNRQRLVNGRPALKIDAKLMLQAREHTWLMATGEKRFVHSGQGAENICWASDGETVAKAMQEWMSSPDHRANILKRSYTKFGGSLFGNFATQRFE